MRSSKTLFGIVLGAFLSSACNGDGNQAGSQAQSTASPSSSATFEVRVENGSGFDHNSPRAMVHMASDQMWGFKASNWYVRVQASGMPDKGSASSTDLIRNNTMLTMNVELDGKQVSASCKPAETPEGVVNRTALDGTHVSGDFRVRFVSCSDNVTGEALAWPSEPFWVEGEFKALALK